MADEKLEQIRGEICRVVGGAGVTATAEQHADLGMAIRIETARHVAHVDPDRLLALLKDLPDDAGPLALREAMEQYHVE